MSEVKRIDVLLVEKNMLNSREKAKSSIVAGLVFVDGKVIKKPSFKVSIDAKIEIKGQVMPFVSRGGLKLKKAIEEFKLDLEGKICMDIGASTGGFTDCMLQSGASKVYAVDVGTGQLDEKLLNDDRVVNIEKTNIRSLDCNLIEDKIDFISIDVSFISLDLVFPKVAELLSKNGQVVFLIKPQFEAGKDRVKRSGVIKDKRIHKEVLIKISQILMKYNIPFSNLTFSPVKGPKGNVEFLGYSFLGNEIDNISILDIDSILKESKVVLLNGKNNI